MPCDRRRAGPSGNVPGRVATVSGQRGEPHRRSGNSELGTRIAPLPAFGGTPPMGGETRLATCEWELATRISSDFAVRARANMWGTPRKGAIVGTVSKFNWADLTTSDRKAAKEFYAGLFGWTGEDQPAGDSQIYTLFSKDGKLVAVPYPVPMPLPPFINTFGSTGMYLYAAHQRFFCFFFAAMLLLAVPCWRSGFVRRVGYQHGSTESPSSFL